MNQKKIASLLVVGVLTVGVVGGTLAWFTSIDTVTNKFSTSGKNTDSTNLNAGIEIVEEFNEDKAEDLTPGANINKDVQVKNTENYNQFIRVKLVKQFVKIGKDNNGKETREVITTNLGKDLSLNILELTFTTHKNTTKESGSWYFNEEDGYYYYLGKVAAGSHTNTLLDDVTFCTTAGNEYRNLGFDIIVEADSIQASNDAYADGWAPESLKGIYGVLQNGEVTEPDDNLEPDTDKHAHKGEKVCDHIKENLVE